MNLLPSIPYMYLALPSILFCYVYFILLWNPIFFIIKVGTTLCILFSDINLICRRFVWNFFRLENEHLNNCGKFRAVRDISVAPIDSSDQSQMIRMMDEEDGVNHRRKKKPPKKTKDDKHKLLSEESLEEVDNSAYIGNRL